MKRNEKIFLMAVQSNDFIVTFRGGVICGAPKGDKSELTKGVEIGVLK